VCGDPLVRDDLVLCLDCDAPHHEGCWVFNKGCSTYGCACKVYAVPPDHPIAGIEEATPVFRRGASPQFLVRWHMGLFPLFFLAVIGGALVNSGVVPVAFFLTWVLVFVGAMAGAMKVSLSARPEEELLEHERKVFGLPAGRREIPVENVSALIVRSYLPWIMQFQRSQQPYGVPSNVQLWMVEKGGKETLIDSRQNEEVYGMLWEAERLADEVGVVVRLESEFFALARPRPELVRGIARWRRDAPPAAAAHGEEGGGGGDVNDPTPVWLPFAIVGGFAVVFPLFWMGIITLVGRIGGWHRLAAAFPFSEGTPEPPGWFAWRSGRLGWAQYRSTISVGPSEQGLHLWTVRFFRAGHPRVLVPWSELEVGEPEDWFFSKRTVVRFPKKDLPVLQLWGDAGVAVHDSWKKTLGA
jgi:hypothetical protein